MKVLEIFGAMAGARTQPNGPVNGLTGTRVAQDTPVDVNQEVWPMWIFLSPVQRAPHGRRLGLAANHRLRLRASTFTSEELT